jgi:pimeloyl-ACP methyl ester carboxylesterase
MPKTMLFLILLLISFVAASDAHTSLNSSFDSLGPTVQNIETKNGRKIHYIDDGNSKGIPVVFTGGLGTSVRAIRLLDFLKTMRNDLNIRMITVERNGFGQTQFNPSLDMSNYAEDVENVLNHLSINRFAVFGISGGGPYTAKIASRNKNRLLSIHMAATSPLIGQKSWCNADPGASIYRDMLAYPMQFFGLPESSTMHQIIGFQDTAFEEAARAHNLRGQSADAAPLDHEIDLYCKEGVIDTRSINADVFVYRGQADTLLKGEKKDIWANSYPNAQVIVRNYAGEGHDIQYRHLDQILLDIAGRGPDVLVCHDGAAQMISEENLAGVLKDRGKLGLCEWQN